MTNACVPGSWPRLLVTVSVVAFVIVVPVDFATDFVKEYETPTLTLASTMKSTPVSTFTLAPNLFDIVVSVDVLSEVLTVRPCEI